MFRSLAAAIAAGWLLMLATITWFVLDPLKYSLVAAVRQSGRMPSVSDALTIIAGRLDAGQVALILAAIGLGLALVVLEWRTRGLSEALTGEGKLSFALFVVLVLWFGHAYLAPGHLLMGDLGNHIAMVAGQLSAVLGHRDPFWTNYQYLGQPLSDFYSPTTFWPITGIALVTGDPTLATKIFLLLAHLLSGVTAYAFTRRLGIGRAAAFLGGLAYAGSFAHLHLILYRGAVPQALSVALLPLALLYLHRVLMEGGYLTKAWLGLAVASAGLLVNYTPFGVAAGLFMALYAAAILGSGAAPWRQLGPLIAAGVAAGGLAAFVLIPAFLASHDNANLTSDRLLHFVLPTREYLDHLLVWRAWRTNYARDSSAYLGLSLVFLAGFGLFAALKDPTCAAQRRPILAMGLLLLVSLAVRGDYLRNTVFTVLAVAVLAAAGADALLRRRAHRRSTPALLFALVLLDLGPTTIQPLGRTDLGAIDRAGRYLADQQSPTRTLEGSIDHGRFRAMRGGGAGLLQLYPAEFVVGGDDQFAGAILPYANLAGAMVENDLATVETLRPDTHDLLCAMRVSRIVAENQTAMGFPASPMTVEEGPLGQVVPVSCGYRVVFAPILAQAEDGAELPEGLDQARATIARIGRDMRLDSDTGLADRILIREAPPAGAAASEPRAKPPSVLSYAVISDRVRIALTTSTPGFLRLSHSWYKQLQVAVNGADSRFFQDAMGLVVVPVQAGASVIEIGPGPEPGRFIGRAASGVTLILLAALATWRARRRSPSG